MAFLGPPSLPSGRVFVIQFYSFNFFCCTFKVAKFFSCIVRRFYRVLYLNVYFNQRLECTAPKRWSKYTTNVFRPCNSDGFLLVAGQQKN